MDHINTLRKHRSVNEINSHFEKYNILFDIASCKLKNIDNCQCQPLWSYNGEGFFIIDQRSNK